MLFDLFKKNKEGKKRGNQYLSLKVREVKRETEDTVSIYFEQPEPYLDYKPGQFLTVILDINGKEERRSYSLCTSPFVDPYPAITVKRVLGGLISNYLNGKIHPGKTMEIMLPMGNFTMEFHSKNRHQYVMITGGSGITPIMSIMKSVLVNEPNSEVLLIYCSRSERQVIFKNELEELEAKYGNKLKIFQHFSQPDASSPTPSCRLDAAKIRDILAQEVNPDIDKVKYLTCGPEGLMDSAIAALEQMGIAKEDILKESFYTSPDKNEEEDASDTNGIILTREVEIVLEGKEYQFEVSPDKTILEAGLSNDIDMPYSCQSGLCTACRGKLISGQVKMEEDAGLSENELKDGFVLCCVSHPLTPDVKINIE